MSYGSLKFIQMNCLQSNAKRCIVMHNGVVHEVGEMIVKLKPGEISRQLDQKGLRRSYRELARILGCSPSLITFYLNDGLGTPSLDMVVKWARYLGVTVEDLIVVEEGEEDEGEPERQRPPAGKRQEARHPLVNLQLF